ncbi:MAG: DUF6498-containing protein [Candidatus Diapherotrites archaeon]|nr:DUF6498-containing protein [Candidatus Diapherotrites archaeon]
MPETKNPQFSANNFDNVLGILTNKEKLFPFIKNSFNKDPTVRLLVLSNISTIIFAIMLQWGLNDILFTYWIQSALIGVFHFLRMAYFKTEKKINNKKKLGFALFFLLHYGFFHFGYLMFIGIPESKMLAGILISALPFAANHAASLVYYLKNSKPKKAKDFGNFMFKPYLRIIPMHFTIILGGFFFGILTIPLFIYSVFTGNPDQIDALSMILEIPVIVFFMFLKTVVDVASHAIEHEDE